jgi:hypothetical protein
MALVAAAAFRISRKALTGRLSYVLMGAAFLASYALGVPFVAILVGCGALGFTLGVRHRQSSKANPRLYGWLFVLVVVGLVTAARLSPPSSPAARSAEPSRAEQASSRRDDPKAISPANLIVVVLVGGGLGLSRAYL